MAFTISNFPAAPDNINKQYIRASAEFKRQVTKVFLLCIFFLITYAAVVAVAISLAALTAVLAVGLAAEVPNFITLMLALGALGLAIMIVYFVFNSLIIKLTRGREGAIQITQKDEPLLFEFIKLVTMEAKAPFPNKVFLTDDFNAAVAYDSVFLSMFFPQRKNLYIGLALINSLTISEFKAVLGHEFGHFSQNSMKLGAYVYHFNLIIHRILFDNERYQNALEKWGNSSWYFKIFKEFAELIIKAMQWVMRKVYVLLNKEHMSLSRQMEFHADAVAVSVSGSESNITAQYRSDFASECYSELLRFYGTLIKENVKAENLYLHHLKIMQLYAAKHGIPLSNGLPIIDSHSFDRLGKNRVTIKDQWASHPSTEDRVALFSKMSVPAEVVKDSAWELFAEPSTTQGLLTDKVYEESVFETDPVLINGEEFERKYLEYLNLSELQPEYKGYYNKRNIQRFDLDSTDHKINTRLEGDLFSDQYTRLPVIISNLEIDITLLDSLSEGNSGIRSFDFDGEKFETHQAEVVKSRLNKELQESKLQLDSFDKAIYYHTLKLCESATDKSNVKQAYADMFTQIERADDDFKLYNEMCLVLNPVYTRMQHSDIKIQIIQIIRKEQELKQRFKEILNIDRIIHEISLKQDLKNLKDLLESNHIYYTTGQYLENELQLLTDALNSFLTIVVEHTFLLKKDALALQCKILNGPQLLGRAIALA